MPCPSPHSYIERPRMHSASDSTHLYFISYKQRYQGNCRKLLAKSNSPCYCSDVRQSSRNHAPKCLPFSILCAKSVIIHTPIACIPIKAGVGVNCNSSPIPNFKKDLAFPAKSMKNTCSPFSLPQSHFRYTIGNICPASLSVRHACRAR